MAELDRVDSILDDGAGRRVRLRLSQRIMDEWAAVVPEPWKSGAEPLVVLGSELYVRAGSGHGVRLLRYAVGDLLAALHARYGIQAVTDVRVVAPSGR